MVPVFGNHPPMQQSKESKHGSDPICWVLVRFFRSLLQSLKDPEFQALFFLVVTLLAPGALFYRRVEGWTLLDSL